MRHKIHEPNLSEWGLDTIDELGRLFESIIKKAAAEALSLSLKEDDTYAYFPILYAPNSDGEFGPAVEDPLLLYVKFALDDGGGEKMPTYEIDLRKALGDLKEMSEPDGFAPENPIYLRRISVALREWANEIDEAATKMANKILEQEKP